MKCPNSNHSTTGTGTASTLLSSILDMEGMTAWPRCAWACAAPAAVFPAPCVWTPTVALAVELCSAVAVAWVRGLPLENHGPTAVDINMGGSFQNVEPQNHWFPKYGSRQNVSIIYRLPTVLSIWGLLYLWPMLDVWKRSVNRHRSDKREQNGGANACKCCMWYATCAGTFGQMLTMYKVRKFWGWWTTN